MKRLCRGRLKWSLRIQIAMASSLYVVKRGKECGLMLSTRYSRVLVFTEMEANASFSQLKLGQVPSRLYFPRHFLLLPSAHADTNQTTERGVFYSHTMAKTLFLLPFSLLPPGARHNLVTHPRAEVIECKRVPSASPDWKVRSAR